MLQSNIQQNGILGQPWDFLQQIYEHAQTTK
jgi:hypothetical protein